MARFTSYPAATALNAADKLLVADMSELPENQIKTLSLSLLHQFFDALNPQSNGLINGGFDLAQRQVPATLTTIADNKYGPDRWRMTRENADWQYQRASAIGESGLTSKYYGAFKKLTSTGKGHIAQVVEGANSVPLRGKNVIFQVKMKASTSTVMRMAVLELQAAGTMDVIPAALVTVWNANGVDPTLGANLAVITGAQSKTVSTSWENFSVQVTVPATSKNLVCAIWTNSQVAAGVTVSLAEAGLYMDDSSSAQAWSPRPIASEIVLCQRYYEKSHDVDSIDYTGTNGAQYYVARVADQQDRFMVHFKAQKFAAPTVTQLAFASGTAGSVRNVSASTDLAASTLAVGQYSFSAKPAANSTANNIYTFHFTAEAEL